MLIFVSCLVIFVYGLLSSLLGTIIPGLADSLHLSNAEIGYLGLAQGFGLAGMSVLSGALMDRHGKKNGVIAGLCATIAGLLLLFYAHHAATVAASMLILGCGGSIVIVGANAITSDVSDKRRAAALNFLNVFSGLGGLITPFVAGNLLNSSPGKTAIFGAAATVVVLAVVIVARIPNTSSGREDGLRAGTSIFRSPALYLLSLITLIYTACEFAIWNWLPKYLIGTGMSRLAALNILSLGFACGLLFGRIVATSVLWRIKPFTVVTLCSIAMGCTTYLVLRPMSTWMTGVVVFLTGVAMAPVFPTTISIVGKLFQKHSATAIGFAITCGFSGLMMSSPVIGFLSGSSPAGIGRALLLLPILSGTILAIFVGASKLLEAADKSTVAIPKTLAHD